MGVLRPIDSEQANFRVARHPELIVERMRALPGLSLLQIPWSREFSFPSLQHSGVDFS